MLAKRGRGRRREFVGNSRSDVGSIEFLLGVGVLVEDTLKVFISSTSDLRRWRLAAMAAIKELGLNGVRFEDWSASPQSPLEECLAKVRESDAFVLLIQDKYGTVVNGLSITHHEYRTAKACIPVFVFLLPHSMNQEKSTRDFLAEVQGVTAGYFRKAVKSTAELKKEIGASLSQELTRRFRAGNVPPENLISGNKSAVPDLETDVAVPSSPADLYTYLREKYDSGEDAMIVRLYDWLNSIPNVDMNLLNFCFMSEINLGLDNFGINGDRIRRAISFWTLSLASLPKEYLPVMHYNIGNANNVLGDFVKAIQHYQSSLDLFSENPECLKNYGSVLFQLGRQHEAVALFERALEINPRHSQSLFSLALINIRDLQNFELGIEQLSSISLLNASPRLSGLIRQWRAFANIKLKNFQEAILDLEEVVTEEPSSWQQNNLDNCYRALAQASEQWKTRALVYWTERVEKYPDDAEAWYERAELSYGLGYATGDHAYFRESVECYKEATDHKVDASVGVLWDHWGHALGHLGRSEESIVAFRNACLWSPEEYTYCLVQELVKVSEFEEALPLAVLDATSFHRDASSWFQVAVCYINLGRIAEAKKSLQRSVKLDRAYAFPVYELGGLFWNQGKRKKAISIWKNALRMFPEFERSGEVRQVVLEYESARKLEK